MIKEEIREDFAPYSRMSIKRYYDEEWNIIMKHIMKMMS